MGETVAAPLRSLHCGSSIAAMQIAIDITEADIERLADIAEPYFARLGLNSGDARDEALGFASSAAGVLADRLEHVNRRLGAR